ncbi:S-methyl-5'-thioadenosine phosphorylase [Chitinivorax sp. PXF-14]|uniref:S-methyl-5'-thioadenosine phosphorylase n=2 Tax=Burkholderia cepacia TaxID=292 RepID=A0A8I1DLB5_BURCE|nr:S-methyl-5'-thioadenosine phosphorylase [Burkholderia cepacia]MBH9696143.1 S-methyl-5'-thioadenosine phosphorylase [Burkholderia cepacia]MBH9712294.1 S-methyl-5'-thioadenosine phosphorylase [Burkholderia cepacia]MBH9732831.1 S-methyl-5'-thioadenosine phosphorylase [Burkholderia cepacia]
MSDALIGIIGGSGLYQLDGLEHVGEERIQTPYGSTSDVVVTGDLNGIRVAFLARHGRGHRLLPSEVPYRANIYALKQLGARYLLSFSAVGSLREDMAPLNFVLPDQYIDLTKRRDSTFFGEGVVAHVSMAQPVCSVTCEVLSRAVRTVLPVDVRLHQGGTYVCIEGPQFSSQAESNWYRSMGASIIGMTNMPEAKLAREAQMAYASLAMVTDYDCWHPREAHVTADMAIANLMTNAERAKLVAAEAIRVLGAEKPDSPAHNALQSAVVTPAEAIPETLKRQLAVLLR